HLQSESQRIRTADLSDFVNESLAGEHASGSENRPPRTVFDRKIYRDVGSLDRRERVRHIIHTPGPILIPSGITRLLWIKRCDVVERAGLGVLPRHRISPIIEAGR